MTALPSAGSERERLRAAFRRADFQPIGFYLPPHRPLTVHSYPSGARGGSTLELMVGVPGLVEHDTQEGPGKEPRTYPLNTGITRITDPLGGVLSVRYVVDGAGGTLPNSRVVVKLGAAAEPIPFYTTDNADENRWRRTLDQTTSPYAQLVSARTIVTARTTTIRSHVRQYPGAVLDAYDGIVGIEERISGLDGTSPTDRPTPLRHSVVEGTADSSPYAYDEIVSFPAGDDARFWLTPAGLPQSWGAWHEIGHHHQQETWDWSAIEEVSVNLYALAVHQHHKGSEDSHGHATVQEWEGAKAFLHKVRTEDLDYNRPLGEDEIYWCTVERLVMFEQLRVIFGESFYRELHKIGRTRDDDVPDIDKQRSS
ncbi:M60 family metallopeptidase [Actinosynnema sp. NPDC050801]|uniref:M60 family metallopeptidase n=1 Tax=unclassified Actinosynnema TaxID=2637065 RepID=UPI003407CF8E